MISNVKVLLKVAGKVQSKLKLVMKVKLTLKSHLKLNCQLSFGVGENMKWRLQLLGMGLYLE